MAKPFAEPGTYSVQRIGRNDINSLIALKVIYLKRLSLSVKNALELSQAIQRSQSRLASYMLAIIHHK